MPVTRIAIASNAEQSRKAPLLLPSAASLDPTKLDSCRTLVFKSAQSKLRLKKPSRIFVAKGGKELLTEDDWKNAIKDDVVLLVSLGEDYVGATNKPATTTRPELSTPSVKSEEATISILSNRAYVDPLSITQLKTTADTLPGIIHGIAQPDLHPGSKFPIGAVFVSEGWIHPPLIGGDIGCGMAWYKTTLSPSQVDGLKGQRVAENLRGLEGRWRTQSDRISWLASSTMSTKACSTTADPTSAFSTRFSAGPEFDSSLGTIGAGNHFAELQIVEDLVPGSWQDLSTHGLSRRLRTGDVVLLVHSGSRGYGGDILKRYTANEQASIPADSTQAKDYLSEHDRACAWADRNRDLIALRFLARLEPGNETWNLGINADMSDSSASTTAEASIQSAYQAIQSRKVVEICHNSMSLSLWPPPQSSSPSPTASPPSQKKVFIHRKGAAPVSTFHSSQSQAPLSSSAPLLLPLLPLPGSRGTPTLILHPILSEQNSWGVTNALSLAHGAGRAMSRTKAATSIAAKWHNRIDDILRGDGVRRNASGSKIAVVAAKKESGAEDGEETMEEQERLGRKVNGGTWVVCEDKALAWEEAPEAYKDVWDVGRDLVEIGAAKRVGWCRGVVSYKVRKE